MTIRHPTSFLSALLWVGLVGGVSPAFLEAQVREVSLEVGGSSVRPPLGVEGETARFVVAGIRAMSYGLGGTGVMASFQAGRSLNDGSGGDFFSGTLEGSYWRSLSGGWSAGLEARGFGFEVVDPFPYRALGMEGGPGIRFESRNVTASLKGVVGTGWSRTELLPLGTEAATVLEEDLWRVGTTAEVLVGSQKFMVGVAAGVHDSPGGTYRSVGGRLLLKGIGPLIQFMVDSWDTPMGQETTGGMGLAVPLRGWNLRGFLGRTEPDPLTLAEPGSGAGGIMIGRRLLGEDPLPAAAPPLHEVLAFEEGQARIRVSVRAPRGTQEVELMGDFTFWEPIPMTRDGDEWSLELGAAEGIHHFGFLVDGIWFLPEDAPDAVADDWGRKNATMVIER